MMLRTIKEHTQVLANYIPGGELFVAKNIVASNLYKFLSGLSPEMLKVDEFIKTYRELIIPDKLDEVFISDWEKALGIPDDCFSGNGTITQRRTHVLAKLASLGVQTVADFQAMATIFGVDVTVVPGVEENGSADPDDRFRIYVRHLELPSDTFPLLFPINFGSETLNVITCLFDKLKPANCEVIFKELGWDIDDVIYDSISLDISPETIGPRDIFIRADGVRIYIVEQISNTVYQYTMSTPWDLSTASYDTVSFSVASEDTTITAIGFKDDGTKMYILGNTNNSIYQYTLSTPWDVSTGSYDTVSFSVASEETLPNGIYFKDDGTKLYIVGTSNDTVYQYTMSTPWDLSTASYDTVSFSVASELSLPQGLFFKPNGETFYIIGSSTDTVYQYEMSTPWDLSTAIYSTKSYDVSSEETLPYGVSFRQDNGTKMYVIGAFSDAIHQYTVD